MFPKNCSVFGIMTSYSVIRSHNFLNWAHSVGGSIVLLAVHASVVVCRLMSLSVGVCNTPRRNVTHQGAARIVPVVLHPVRATPCILWVSYVFLTVS